MRSVNANLLEINQAKSRINQAKQEGKNPEQKDLDLVKTEKQNAFAISQYTDVMTIEKFAKHITSHGSVYSRADISAILYMAVDCMRKANRPTYLYIGGAVFYFTADSHTLPASCHTASGSTWQNSWNC